ncbi:MAG: 2-hydroxyacid dehydrogenase [Dehalococcoidia bacterium]|nr:2-hydroxyacid dehydrogenase [Dehalococcoidia bacterium]
MQVAVFSAKNYDRVFLERANEGHGHTFHFVDARLSSETAALARGIPVVCPFVNDVLDEPVLEQLAANGTRHIALRSAGFNHVALSAAERLGLVVSRVPAYSPHAVAEHTVALMLSLSRHVHRAFSRVREGNFALEGLLGFDFYGKTVGIVGTGKIGQRVAHIMLGFGCRVLAYDIMPDPECRELGVEYVSREELFESSDIITLHCPLTPETDHLIDDRAIARMKQGVMIINTGRGALVDTLAVIEALKTGKIGYLGLDVYEEEADLFFEDRSRFVITDDTFARLLTFPNVLITGHQGFFTREAMQAIAETTLANITAFERDGEPLHRVTPN